MTAHEENQSTVTEWPGHAGAPPPSPGRDQHGRFLTGNSDGGRPKGSRNKLAESFLKAMADDFAEHGAITIELVRLRDPACYLKLIGSLIHRELIMHHDLSPPIDHNDLSDDELA
jgi:hypothetical protein